MAQTKWRYLHLPVSSFPLAAPDQARLSALRRALWKDGAPEAFLQVAQLHQGDCAARLPRYAAKLTPDYGLGVRPDREPPHLWTQAELFDLEPGAAPRPLMELAMHLDGPERERAEAASAMSGFGSLLEVWTGKPARQWFDSTSPLLSENITEAPYLGFPFYLPVLDRKSLNAGGAAGLDRWMCGATAYLRESVEDGGVLLISSQPFGAGVEAWIERNRAFIESGPPEA